MQTRTLCRSILAALACGLGTQAFAIPLNAYSIEGVGRANAGDVAIHTSAFAMSANPALMSKMEHMQLSAAIGILLGETEDVYSTSTYYYDDAEVTDIHLPTIAFVWPITKEFAWGVSLQAEHSLYSDDDVIDWQELFQSIYSTNLGFSVALGEKVSL